MAPPYETLKDKKIFAIEFHGEGGASSNVGVIAISDDGTANGQQNIYLTGPGNNGVLNVSVEQYLARANMINTAYCYRLPISFEVRQDTNKDIVSVTLTI
jgi:hypothetical protein